MPIFQIKKKSAHQIPSDIDYFKNEAALRDFFADNLEQLLGMKFLANEYYTVNGRIDTLAIDEAGSPVIIEYKWGQDNAMFVQGLFYLDWLKKNKRHFDLLVADKLGKDVKVNWINPCVILIAQGFDNRTMIAVKQVDNVELMKYVPYRNSILYLENVYIPGSEKRTKQRVNKEDKKEDYFDIEYHFKRRNSTEDVKDLFYKLQDKIKSLPEVEEVTNQKSGITYKTTKSFVRLEFRKTFIDVLVRSPKYKDPKKIVADISTHMWGYKGKIKLKKVKDIDDTFEIIRQSYEETL